KKLFQLFCKSFLIIILSVTSLTAVHAVGQTSGDQVKSDNYIDDLALAGTQTGGAQIDNYTSDVITSNIPAWMIGAAVTLGNTDYQQLDKVPTLFIRYSQDQTDWSEWTRLYFNDNDYQSPELYADPYALDFAANYFQYQISLDNNLPISQVKLVFLDPTQYDNAHISSSAQILSAETVLIISRTQWGADESIMFWEDDMEHARIDQVIIHHTAANDNTPIDPEATIRGIYYFHTIERGWGDIGYNYLVDHHGNIYEGRKGGLGVVAAHAYGFNHGSVGISVLGNYEEEYPADNSIDAVVDLISFISFQTDLNLESVLTLNGESYDAVSGHRDVNATACPGEKFYELLPDIIDQAIDASQNYEDKTYMTEYLDQSSYFVELSNSKKADITVEYKNTGNAAWLEGLDEVLIVTSGEAGRDSKFADISWNSTSQVGDMYQYTTMPGETGEFHIVFSGIGQKGNFLEKFSLMGPHGIIPNSEFNVLINSQGNADNPDGIIKPTNNFGVGPARYRATFYDSIGEVTIKQGEKKKVWIEFLNDGDNIWYNFDPFPMHLGATNPPDRHSDFYSSNDWLTPNRINLLQTYVSPGEVAHFEFTLDTTNVPTGTYHETFSPVIEHLTWLDTPATIDVTVN
ncbi:N-acetylmuramoyl-L-alanine amidase, partial [Patescibacteria group bacterium]|nr:N-acetylmuramoyl-L-alanine amidase [Patescibacteria group bacterium]